MDTSIKSKIVVGQRRFTKGHRMVGGEEEESGRLTIMKGPSDGLKEKQKHGVFLAFGSGWTALGCIDPNNKNNIIIVLFIS